MSKKNDYLPRPTKHSPDTRENIYIKKKSFNGHMRNNICTVSIKVSMAFALFLMLNKFTNYKNFENAIT